VQEQEHTVQKIIIPGEGVRSVVDSLTKHEQENYSIVRAILAADNDAYDAPLERELSDAIRKGTGKTTMEPGGVLIPTQMNRSGLVTSSAGAGGNLVQTSQPDLVDLIRPRSVVLRSGAQFLPGLSSTVALPVQLSGSQGQWVGENPGADQAESDSSFAAPRSLSPHMYTITTSYSRKFLTQASFDVEKYVRNDIARYMATAVDQAAINGPGGNAPTGILGTATIGLVAAGTNGAVPSYQNILDLETAIGAANADQDSMVFISTPQIRSRLKNTIRLAGQAAGTIWSDDNRVLSYKAFATTNVPSNLVKGTSGAVCHAAILGDMSALAVGEFSTIEVVVDPFRLKKQAEVEVTLYGIFDVAVLTPVSFAVVKDFLQ
jgi:HK97 family phage major capsid protein